MADTDDYATLLSLIESARGEIGALDDLLLDLRRAAQDRDQAETLRHCRAIEDRLGRVPDAVRDVLLAVPDGEED